MGGKENEDDRDHSTRVAAVRRPVGLRLGPARPGRLLSVSQRRHDGTGPFKNGLPQRNGVFALCASSGRRTLFLPSLLTAFLLTRGRGAPPFSVAKNRSAQSHIMNKICIGTENRLAKLTRKL